MIVPSPYDAQLARIPVSVHTVPVLGTDTRYWEYGDPASTTTIVMVHGFRGDHHGLEPVVAQLAGYRILSPDLPGFGESAPLTTLAHDVPGYSEWLRGFVAAVYSPTAPTARNAMPAFQCACPSSVLSPIAASGAV